MKKYLVIVESPAKARTIQEILGKNYEVSSSMGHIVDLATNKLSVDVEGGFAPHYRVIPGKEKIIASLKKSAQGKTSVYIATDPDREGEAIGWHIQEKLAKVADNFYRVTFHEITENALKEAFSEPVKIDMHKVDSQIARRVLDRIVGYYLSPLLWKKIVRGLSAGRVQSVALKFIVEREKEIKNFIPKTTYSIEATFNLGSQIFKAKLEKYKNKPAIFETKEDASRCIEELKREHFLIKEVMKKEFKRRPPSPLTTSLLQQDAFNRLHFSSQRTMLIAQKLYEGVKINEKSCGLITYMRTDSLRIAPQAKNEIRGFIQRNFGNKYLPEKEYHYKEKKGAQLAHEAIRPTDIKRELAHLTAVLSEEEAKLYRLIWMRTVSCQMHEAIFENTKVYISSHHAQFVAEGKKLIFDGFLRVLEKEGNEEVALPEVEKNSAVNFVKCEIAEHTTKPPARFNDASLVKLLEEKGIGRPSTYAPTIYTLLARNYLRRERNGFRPTDLGIKVVELLAKNFSDIIDDDFTASMEEKLDAVEEGKLAWRKVLEEFYPDFKAKIEHATAVLQKEVEFVGRNCPQCHSPLVVKWSRKGKFLSCASFPKCRYAESITTETNCPSCKEGKLIERRNKRGQFFYGCSRFPQCHYTSRRLPQNSETNNNTSGTNNSDNPQNSNDESKL